MKNQNITRLIALQTKINNSMNSVNKIKSLAKTAKLINFLAIKTNLSFLAKNVISARSQNQLVSETQLSIFKSFNHQLFFDYLSTIIKQFFLSISCIISKPRFELSNQHLLIKIVYFNYNNKALVFNNDLIRQIKMLICVLSRLLNRKIIFQLTAINKPNLDCLILAKTISIITDIFGKNFTNITNRIINYSNFVDQISAISERRTNFTNIDALTGINFRLAGRLTRQTIIPKITVKTLQTGSLSRKNTNCVTSAKIIANNRKGTFCYTITFGHRFY